MCKLAVNCYPRNCRLSDRSKALTLQVYRASDEGLRLILLCGLMPYYYWIIGFFVRVVMATVCLWAAMKLIKEDGSFLALLAAASIASLVAMLPIPYVGWLLSFVVLLVLISKWTTAEIWPGAAAMVIVAWCLSALANAALSMAFR